MGKKQKLGCLYDQDEKLFLHEPSELSSFRECLARFALA
jgi:hypothetical protein